MSGGGGTYEDDHQCNNGDDSNDGGGDIEGNGFGCGVSSDEIEENEEEDDGVNKAGLDSVGIVGSSKEYCE